MFALRIKAQRPERTAKYVGKNYSKEVIHIIQEVSNGHTGREANPTPVSTPALMPAKKGSAVIPKSVISMLGLCKKSSTAPRFWKIPMNTEVEASGLEMPCLPVGAQGSACPVGFWALLCWRRALGTRRAGGRDGEQSGQQPGTALEREAETVRETGSQ